MVGLLRDALLGICCVDRHTLYLKVTIICSNFFCGFGLLCILLVLNFAWDSQLMILMKVCSQYKIFESVKFCANTQKYQSLVPANNSHLIKVYDTHEGLFTI